MTDPVLEWVFVVYGEGVRQGFAVVDCVMDTSPLPVGVFAREALPLPVAAVEVVAELHGDKEAVGLPLADFMGVTLEVTGEVWEGLDESEALGDGVAQPVALGVSMAVVDGQPEELGVPVPAPSRAVPLAPPEGVARGEALTDTVEDTLIDRLGEDEVEGVRDTEGERVGVALCVTSNTVKEGLPLPLGGGFLVPEEVRAGEGVQAEDALPPTPPPPPPVRVPPTTVRESEALLEALEVTLALLEVVRHREGGDDGVGVGKWVGDGAPVLDTSTGERVMEGVVDREKLVVPVTVRPPVLLVVVQAVGEVSVEPDLVPVGEVEEVRRGVDDPVPPPCVVAEGMALGESVGRGGDGLALLLPEALVEVDTVSVGVPVMDVVEQGVSVLVRLSTPLLRETNPLRVLRRVAEAHRVGRALERDALGESVAPDEEEGERELDREALGLPVGFPEAEEHWEGLGEWEEEVVTLGLGETRGEVLGERVEEPHAVEERVGFGEVVWEGEPEPLKDLRGEGVRVPKPPLPVGDPVAIEDSRADWEVEAVTEPLLVPDELPLEERVPPPPPLPPPPLLWVALSAVGEPLGESDPQALTEAEAEGDLEALELPLGWRVVEVQGEARDERDRDGVALGLLEMEGEALVVGEKDTEEERERVGLVVGLEEREDTRDTLPPTPWLPVPHTVLDTVGTPTLPLLDPDTLAVGVVLRDWQRVPDMVGQEQLVEEGLGVMYEEEVPP